MSSTISCDLTTAVDGLREIGREFHGRGWSVGTSSNYSVVLSRQPLELLVTASGKDKGQLDREDFVRVDARGEPTRDGQPKSSAETLLHTVLAEELPEVGAILHTHSVWSTLLSQLHYQAGGFAVEDFEMLKGLQGVTTHEHREWVEIFDNTQDIPSLAAQVREQLQTPQRRWQHGFLIRQHGLYTWGRDLFEARRHIEIFEFLFECLVRQKSL
jgi:methylthioribulose-1-phosphate dehydratase